MENSEAIRKTVEFLDSELGKVEDKETRRAIITTTDLLSRWDPEEPRLAKKVYDLCQEQVWEALDFARDFYSREITKLRGKNNITGKQLGAEEIKEMQGFSEMLSRALGTIDALRKLF